MFSRFSVITDELKHLKHRWLPSSKNLNIAFGPNPKLGKRVSFHKSKVGLSFCANPRVDPESLRILLDRLKSVAKILDFCMPNTHGLLDLSDGEGCGAGIISMCANHPDSILIPDFEFIGSRAYAKLCKKSADAAPFLQRNDLVLWRGSTTGYGTISTTNMTSDASELNARTRMCLLLRDIPNCDVKISGIAQSEAPETDLQRLIAAKIFGQRIPAEHWRNVRYHIAIDGNTLAWSSTFTRLIMGCCVLKPDSKDGYLQWYSADFEPWVHYVPVSADLSNLVERITWCRAHEQECANIAARGKKFAHALNYKSEIVAAARRIDQASLEGKLETLGVR